MLSSKWTLCEYIHSCTKFKGEYMHSCAKFMCEYMYICAEYMHICAEFQMNLTWIYSQLC